MKSVFKSSRPARDGESCLSFNQINRPASAIDCNYQSSAPAFRGGMQSLRHIGQPLVNFRAMSSGFFKAEARREYWLEAAGFVVLTALAVWPMWQAVQAMADLIK